VAETSTSLRSSKINISTRKILAAVIAVALIALTVLGGISMSGTDETELPVVSDVEGEAPTI
jgi:hypothetical protein